MSDITRNGLRYRYVYIHGDGGVLQCRRCDAYGKEEKIVSHICAPHVWLEGRLGIVGEFAERVALRKAIDRKASLGEQYEAASIMFAEEAARMIKAGL